MPAMYVNAEIMFPPSVIPRSEEHTSELHHVRISYAVFCLKKKNNDIPQQFYKHLAIYTILKQREPPHNTLLPVFQTQSLHGDLGAFSRRTNSTTVSRSAVQL